MAWTVEFSGKGMTPIFSVITYSKHAERQMRKRRLSWNDVELALRMGEAYEDDDGTWVYDLGHIRVVVVERGRRAHVVTVIRLRRHT